MASPMPPPAPVITQALPENPLLMAPLPLSLVEGGTQRRRRVGQTDLGTLDQAGDRNEAVDHALMAAVVRGHSSRF